MPDEPGTGPDTGVTGGESAASDPVDAPRARPTVGLIGFALADLGALLIVLAYTVLDWFYRSGSTFGSLRELVDRPNPVLSSVSKAYFTWLGWLLFAVVYVVAVAANVSWRPSAVLRIVGPVLVLVAVGFTFWAIKFLTTATPSYGDYLRNQLIGFYAAVVGFVLIGTGAALGRMSRWRLAPARQLSRGGNSGLPSTA